MADIVGGFLMPHEPALFAVAGSDRADAKIEAAYSAVRERIAELDADTAIIVGADHYVLFGPQCLPACLIGIGDVSGPYERFPGMDQGAIDNHKGLAHFILDHGRANGFDWSASKSLRVDHSIGGPARLCVLPNEGRRVIPVYLASGVAPVIPMSRAHALGGAIAAAVREWPGPERVVVIGSGGISHWVGTPEMGQLNPAFDQRIIDYVIKGDVEGLLGLSDTEILREGGNGGMEIRNFACAMGALPGCVGRLIEYRSGPTWLAGLGFIELLPNQEVAR